MITLLLNYLSDLRAQTELLEALDWDEELLQKFSDEMTTMLMASPPNIEKALFWLRNTPWDCFDDQPIPDKVWPAVNNLIRSAERSVYQEIQQKEAERNALPFHRSTKNDNSEWN